MRGLGTDHCAHHHLAILVAEALGGKVSHIILNVLDSSGDVTCVIRLATAQGLVDATVDVAAALALAIHLGLPIFLEGNSCAPTGNCGPSRARLPKRDRLEAIAISPALSVN